MTRHQADLDRPLVQLWRLLFPPQEPPQCHVESCRNVARYKVRDWQEGRWGWCATHRHERGYR